MIYKLSEIALINPKESLPSGSLAKKVAMEKLQPFCRDIDGFELTKYNGGTKFRNGDTIMARITPCLENGKIAKVNILDEKEIGFGSTEYIIFRAKPGVTDEDYLYYLITSPIVRNPAIKSMVGSSGRQRVQTDVIQNLEIDVPELPIQKKIGSILKRIDDKITLNNEINDNLYDQIQTTIKNYLPYSSDDQIPGWKKVNLSTIASFIGGYSYKSSELVNNAKSAMATIKNFERNGGFKLDGFKEIEPSAKLKLQQSVELFDTLVAHTDLTQNAEVVGNAEILLTKSNYEKIIFSTDLVKVLPKSGFSKFLLGGILQDKRFKKHCLGFVNGSTVLHLSKNALPTYELLLPINRDELIPLAELLRSLYLNIAAHIDENIRLSKLRDTLLPKLMSGEIDVDSIEL